MRQAILVIAALMASGCLSKQQVSPVAPPTSSLRADSLRIARKPLVMDSLILKQLQDTSLQALARELRASQRKP